MAKINKRELTRLEIVQEATKCFLENGYTDTTIKSICKNLQMSPGNLTFYFPTKEHLLSELVQLLCDFQWKMMKNAAGEEGDYIAAFCLELTAMVAMCEKDAVAKDFYLSTYVSPICLDIIRRNDTRRAMQIFQKYRPDWTEEQFAEAEILVSGMEYATLMTAGDTVLLEDRIVGALRNILQLYGVPEEVQEQELQKVLSMDYSSIGSSILKEFRKYVAETQDITFRNLIKL